MATFPAPLLNSKRPRPIKGAASALVKGRSSPADLNRERHRVRSCGTVRSRAARTHYTARVRDRCRDRDRRSRCHRGRRLRPHHIGQPHLLAAILRKKQWQTALALIAGVIDNDEISRAVVARPGVCNKILRGPVAGPCLLRLDLRPVAVAEVRVCFRPAIDCRRKPQSRGSSARPGRGRDGSVSGAATPWQACVYQLTP